MRPTITASFVLFALFLTSLPGAQDPTAGLWLSEGYGLLLDISPSRIIASEITSVSCLPAWTAKRDDSEPGAWIFKGGFASGEERVRVLAAGDGDKLILKRIDDLAPMHLYRVSSRPASCEHSPADTPVANYDVLWSTFAENYPFFELHSVDWNAVNRRFRPRVTPQTTPDELFSIFRQMLAPLHDSHVVLDVLPAGAPRGKDWLKTPLKEVWEHKRDPAPLSDADFDVANDIIRARYLGGSIQSFCHGKIRFGTLTVGDKIGYLGVLSFHQYTDDDAIPAGLACLESASDVIFPQTQGFKGLVIDIRSNGGGEDAFVLELASRLTNRRYLAFAKQVRIPSPGDVRFSPLEPVFVEPQSSQAYLGPAVLLTGRHSASAAETFTMALMGRLPEICRIGESTQGVFSDVLDRRLPNGWRLVLPNEVYRNEQGESFDVRGVPPDVRTPGMSHKSINKQRDPDLEKAIVALSSK